MNSEELELSLRSEFEVYLKDVLAEMRQEALEFQSNIEAEFAKHKSQFDEAFQGFAARFDSERTFNEAFTGSVAEHLSLARDEGAKIAANAMVEAEKLGEPTIPVVTKYDAIRDAVKDISTKDSQSAILKSLVQHASEFAPRGAFFIIKNEHFVGWKIFGTEDETAENAIREIHFPTSADSILGSAVESKMTVENSTGGQSGDSAFMEPLQFGQPNRMYAIPLIARGRGVAVLYADHGEDDADLNREALETLVSVAGLTVELLASMHTAKTENRQVAAADFEDSDVGREFEYAQSTPAVEISETVESRFEETSREMPAETPVPVFDDVPAGFAFKESVSFESGFPQEAEPANPFEAEPSAFKQYDNVPETAPPPTLDETPYAGNPFEASPFEEETPRHFDPVETFEPVAETFERDSPVFESEAPVFETEAKEEATTGGDFVFDSGGSIETAPPASSPFDQFEQPVEQYEPAPVVSNSGFEQQVAEPVIEAPMAASPHARLSDRPVDLPIEVPEEERRIHNDARRFARLLVSEIKLYNEKKVTEGREASDLYDRLREAIDRSREMYDKRVQPPVAAKFDYFHYEIVNSLADGHADRLGSGYPGSSV